MEYKFVKRRGETVVTRIGRSSKGTKIAREAMVIPERGDPTRRTKLVEFLVATGVPARRSET